MLVRKTLPHHKSSIQCKKILHL